MAPFFQTRLQIAFSDRSQPHPSTKSCAWEGQPKVLGTKAINEGPTKGTIFGFGEEVPVVQAKTYCSAA